MWICKLNPEIWTYLQKPHLNSIKSEFQWKWVNFEALYLPNYEDFALGQHIKFVEL
jgi:hypothetical protein